MCNIEFDEESEATDRNVSVSTAYIEIYREVEVECGECGRTWLVSSSSWKGGLPPNWWVCPDGCNGPSVD